MDGFGVKTERTSAFDEEMEKIRVLIVDDEAPIRRLLGRLLDMSGHDCTFAADAKEARAFLADGGFQLLLCDVNMPGESGLDFIKYAIETHPDTAVIMVTAADDQETVEAALDIGAYGYIVKPFKPSEVAINIENVLRRRQLEIENRNHRNALEKTVSVRTEELHEALLSQKRIIRGIVSAMALTLEMRDPYTAGHQRRVAELSRAIAEKQGISGEHSDCILMAGTIHDLGKIAVPAEILSKPGRLSSAEFDLIRNHPRIGFEILKDIEFPWPIAKIIFQHHEREDGSGYPMGLTSDEIMKESKILAVADVVEAMASHRPYRPSLGLEAALDEISSKRGIWYDSKTVDACLELFEKNEFCFDRLM